MKLPKSLNISTILNENNDKYDYCYAVNNSTSLC